MPNLEPSHISNFDIATPLIIAAIFLTIAIVRPFVVLVHELGHAIPALIFTNESVSIYIGSYWDPDKCFCLNIGRFNIWIKRNPLLWYKGSCMPAKQVVSTYKNLIYIISGPLMPFILGIIFCYLTFSFELHGSLKYFSIIFLSWAILDLIINLYPTSYPTKLEDGKILYSDGFQLIKILGFNRFKSQYESAVVLYNNKEYNQASEIFNKLLSIRTDQNLFRLTINSYLQIHNYDKAKELNEHFQREYQFNDFDYFIGGAIYMETCLYDIAIEYYSKSIDMNPNYENSLNNMGYTLILLERYSDSIIYFDKAIAINPNNSYSLNNRGLALIKTGNLDKGFEDIKHSISINVTNAYAYRNLGIYYIEKQQYNEALSQLNKCYELDPATPNVNALIAEAIEKAKN